jgi:hypothetical protein
MLNTLRKSERVESAIQSINTMWRVEGRRLRVEGGRWRVEGGKRG